MTVVRPVEDNVTVLKLVNPIVKAVLRSPLARILGNSFMLVTFTGKKSGKQYTTPTACIQNDGFIYFATGTNWWKNLQGGAAVTLVVTGQKVQGFADVVTDPGEVARLMKKFLVVVGSKKAYLFGLKVIGTKVPTIEEIQSGLNGCRVIVRVELPR